MKLDILKTIRDALLESDILSEDRILIDTTPDADWNREPIIIVSEESRENELSMIGPVVDKVIVAVAVIAGNRDAVIPLGEKAFQIAYDAIDNLWGVQGIQGLFPFSSNCGNAIDVNGNAKRDEFIWMCSMQIFQSMN